MLRLGLPTLLVALLSSLNALTHLCESLPASLRGAWLRSTFVVSSPRLAQACRARGAEADDAQESLERAEGRQAP